MPIPIIPISYNDYLSDDTDSDSAEPVVSYSDTVQALSSWLDLSSHCNSSDTDSER